MRTCNYSETMFDYYAVAIIVVVVYLILMMYRDSISLLISAFILFFVTFVADVAVKRIRKEEMWCNDRGCL